ncbi:MAG: hypothetical protein JRH18_22440 [Deltaproteobacteria bacterium]|nr:hypothetical protein [Deltaproteobacteria bacterium]
MGHISLRKWPGTPNWKRVAILIDGGAGVPEVAKATLDAATRGFNKATEDPTIAHAIYLLIKLAQAAEQPQTSDFQQSLRDIGIDVKDPSSVLGFTSAFLAAVDKYNRSLTHRSDIGEIGQMAATASLTAVLSDKAGGLFGESPEAVHSAIRYLVTQKGFSNLMSEFTGDFLRRYLTYFLSMELSNHVGSERRFVNIQEHLDFKKALDQHCRQIACIVEEYAGAWLLKKRREGEEITPEAAKGFWGYAIRKVQRYMNKGIGIDGV